jgi:hypothetical protein
MVIDGLRIQALLLDPKPPRASIRVACAAKRACAVRLTRIALVAIFSML